jgi:hypothetical protein
MKQRLDAVLCKRHALLRNFSTKMMQGYVRNIFVALTLFTEEILIGVEKQKIFRAVVVLL